MDNTPLSTTFNEQVGNNLRTLRAAVGHSQTDLAEAMTKRGFPWQQQTVLKIEKGARPLRFEEADALAGVLGCTLEQVRAYDVVAEAQFELRKVQTDILRLENEGKQVEHNLNEAHDRARTLTTLIKEATNVER